MSIAVALTDATKLPHSEIRKANKVGELLKCGGELTKTGVERMDVGFGMSDFGELPTEI